MDEAPPIIRENGTKYIPFVTKLCNYCGWYVPSEIKSCIILNCGICCCCHWKQKEVDPNDDMWAYCEQCQRKFCKWRLDCRHFKRNCCRYCHCGDDFEFYSFNSDEEADLESRPTCDDEEQSTAAAASAVPATAPSAPLSAAASDVLALRSTVLEVFNGCPHNCKMCVITSQFSGKCNIFCGNCKI